MRAVIQRVSEATVTVGGVLISQIGNGLLVLLGVEDADTAEDAEWLANKIVGLRIFNDDARIPNLTVTEVQGNVLIISQFTLFAATKKGNRPSYIRASKAAIAQPMYKYFVAQAEKILGKPVYTGEFGADMKVKLVNDGPFTITIDTKNKE